MEKVNIKDARIAAALKDSMPELYDGVFIMFHRKTDNYPRIVKPDMWISYQTMGEVADGVAIIEGGKIVVISPTENKLPWSSAAVSGGGTTTSDHLVALSDWNGKSSTLAQILKPECAGENFAAGFCNKYSRTNINGQGLTAGKWWLPSLGELMLIYANVTKINAALALINGAKLFANGLSPIEFYATSTECDRQAFWILHLHHGYPSITPKYGTETIVRPVSSYLL